MKFSWFIAPLLGSLAGAAQAQQPVQAPYLDARQPIGVRVNDLLGRLTLEEKTGLMLDTSPAVPRLNVPAYSWWNEALHGVGRSGGATVFPQAIGLGATFDDELALRVATAISDEARAMYNVALAKNYRLKYGGLTFWTPNVNIFRDPRWGRGQETYGEDPYLTSRLGVAFVKGLQGPDPRYLKVAACAKHYAVHSGPEKLRHEFNAVASPQDLRETYLPAFKALVEAKVEAVMCAYNSTNGEPCCGNTYLLQDVLRQEWRFRGHVVSDCGALDDLYQGHKVVKTAPQAAALAVQRGVNLSCGNTYAALPEAVRQHLITTAQLDTALAGLLRTRIRLGMFDPKNSTPYDALAASTINSEKHRQLAREVALKSMVLLKNNGALPLRNDLRKYYVTGPHAASLEALLGNYYGVNGNMTTVLEGVTAAIQPGSQVEYKPGILPDRPNVNPIDWTTGDAKAADATIVVLGITGALEGEEGEAIASPHAGDRLDYTLPGNQVEFLRKLRLKNTKPIIAVVIGGSPMDLAPLQELADAVLLAWYPGEEGGHAVADIIFGNASPSGKLPVTFPQSLSQLPAYDNYAMAGRTYRYMTAEPLYPFGFGLSYARFAYPALKLSTAKATRTQPVTVEATVENTGAVAGEEVVQLYVSHKAQPGRQVPLYSLRGVRRVRLQPGARTTVTFTLTPELLALVNDQGKAVPADGPVTIWVGGSLPTPRSQALGAAKPATATLVVR